MSRKIWKFQLAFTTPQQIKMPAGAEILHVGVQHGNICLWAAVDATAPVTGRRFALVGTDHETPEGAANYLGTVQLTGGALILHVYEQLQIV